MARMPQQDLSEDAESGSAGTGLLLITLGLMAIGVVMVHSALAGVGGQTGKWYARVDFRQTLFAIMGVLAMLAVWRFDYRLFARGKFLPVLATILLVCSLGLALLVYVPGVGHSVGGYKRWIRFNAGGLPMQFQPSELVKIFLIIWLAAWLSQRGPRIGSFFRTFAPACGVIGLCLGLLATQDFGTATIIGVSACAVMFIAGVPLYYFATLIPPAAAAFYMLVVQHPMRWARITAMADVWSQSNPSAYQPRESLLAILSGGWFGKGVGNGVIKLGYLPEDSTDFVFAIFCEEWGFVGAVLLAGLFVAWLLLARRAANGSSDPFGRLLAGSLAFMVGIQAVIHVGVDVGALPATGLNLPFVSAGGTSVILLACAAAMIASVAHRAARLRQAQRRAQEEQELRRQFILQEMQAIKMDVSAGSPGAENESSPGESEAAESPPELDLPMASPPEQTEEFIVQPALSFMSYNASFKSGGPVDAADSKDSSGKSAFQTSAA
ncbi:MAG: FtsW/RodA/SpoVE family cell cycle protein [Planctomycetes bacterium]|nr:FtsW/RodA/SpoVE family cell cycle protein [Planctomycetota bacterium]